MDQQIVKPTVAALMKGLIDYAGLFPPAKLDLDPAIHAYAEYLASSDNWMLSRFIVPAAMLNELEAYSSLFRANPPFHFSVTGRSRDTVADFKKTILEDLERVQQFKERLNGLVSPDLFEVRLPVAGVSTDETLELLGTVEVAKMELSLHSLQFFYEIDWKGDWAKDIVRGCEILARFNQERSKGSLEAGLKLRCGGVDPAEVPGNEIVATALWNAAQRGLSFKATAGLHHPIRHYRKEYGGWMHGFVNVFIAGVLARLHNLTIAQLATVIAQTDPKAFQFEDDFVLCHGWRIPLDELKAHREVGMLSFGSCSFDEPRDDMQVLNLLS